MNNLAQLILDRAERRPEARFGVTEDPLQLADAVNIARQSVDKFAGAGLRAGTRTALIGNTSPGYFLAWLSLQLAGVEVAMVNPSLPDALIQEMLSHLSLDGVVWVNEPPRIQVEPSACHLDASHLGEGKLLMNGREIVAAGIGGELGGLSRRLEDVAGYMHTSGTTGTPKFCTQTHRYFLALGRFVADSMAISPADTVFAPLPMFHINPLGYGVVGGLTGGADVLGATRFSASRFWKTVKDSQVTVAFLHAPPVEILKKATTPEDAAGHQIRAVFLADEEFLRTFRIPMTYSAYGSTEAGGLCHIWTWRLGDHCPHPEGMSRYGGLPRHDVEWDLTDDGEILIRGKEEHILCSGYQTARGLVGLTDEDGWFHTGDLGRKDEHGHLIFIERQAESIRVKGEYVPLTYVERIFAEIEELEEVAVWRRESELIDHEVVLYVVAREGLPREKLAQKAETLPSFMRPSAVVCIPSMPRGAGVGKVSRRKLEAMEVCESFELSSVTPRARSS
jgi:crotonobetaine/carnitine-CoA ligase